MTAKHAISPRLPFVFAPRRAQQSLSSWLRARAPLQRTSLGPVDAVSPLAQGGPAAGPSARSVRWRQSG